MRLWKEETRREGNRGRSQTLESHGDVLRIELEGKADAKFFSEGKASG